MLVGMNSRLLAARSSLWFWMSFWATAQKEGKHKAQGQHVPPHPNA
jgi:hypothetical protein